MEIFTIHEQPSLASAAPCIFSGLLVLMIPRAYLTDISKEQRSPLTPKEFPAGLREPAHERLRFCIAAVRRSRLARKRPRSRVLVGT